jgi:hypothetical protein
VVARGSARFPDRLVIESVVSEPRWAAHERQRLIKTMRKAGFPACAAPSALAAFGDPVHLPEYATASASG